MTADKPRAADRPNVENSASTGTFSFASVAPTSCFTSSCPDAYATSSRASGPTSIGLSFHRGVFRNEYFSYPASDSKGGCGPEYLISVSPSHGCRLTPSPPSYVYHDDAMYSLISCESFGFTGYTWLRSRLSIAPRGYLKASGLLYPCVGYSP